MDKNYQIYQGDVGIIAINKPDKELAWKKMQSGFIVAYGLFFGRTRRTKFYTQEKNALPRL